MREPEAKTEGMDQAPLVSSLEDGTTKRGEGLKRLVFQGNYLGSWKQTDKSCQSEVNGPEESRAIHRLFIEYQDSPRLCQGFVTVQGVREDSGKEIEGGGKGAWSGLGAY